MFAVGPKGRIKVYSRLLSGSKEISALTEITTSFVITLTSPISNRQRQECPFDVTVSSRSGTIHLGITGAAMTGMCDPG